jgi:hypothetical protein
MTDVINVDEVTNDTNAGTRSFFLLAQLATLLVECHQHGHDLQYEIKACMTEGVNPPRTKDDLPKPTGGYEIRIWINPY